MFNVIASVFIMIALGYLAKVAGLLKKEDGDVINRVIIYVTLPALIYGSVRDSHFTYAALWVPVIGFATMAIALALFWPVASRLAARPAARGMALLGAVAGNTGYLGYPLTQLILGRQFVVDAIYFDLFGTVLFLFTVGLFIGERYGEAPDALGRHSRLRAIATFPPLIALAASYALKGLVLPAFLTVTIGTLAQATVPLIMISIGLALEPVVIGEGLPLVAAATAIKLAVVPAVALALAYAFGVGGTLAKVVILEASMPVAMLSLIVGARYELDSALGSLIIVLTTVLSIATMPFWQWLAGMVF